MNKVEMKLKEIISLVDSEDQLIALIVDDQWCCVFLKPFLPKQFEDYTVKNILPDNFDGEGPFDGIVLKVWI